MALKTGDYSKLAELGYNTDYLQRVQNAELEQLALEAQKLRNQVTKSASRSSGGSGGGGGGGNGNETGQGTSGLTKNGYTFLLMNYKLHGDTDAFAQAARRLIAEGSVSQADYEKFLKNYA